MKKLILTLLLVTSNSYADVVCDEEKTVNGVDVCVINVPLDIPKSLVASGAIDIFANNQGYPSVVKEPGCVPSAGTAEVTCTPEEEAVGCVPHAAVAPVVCSDVPNPMSKVDYCKGLIRLQVREQFRKIYKQMVVDASTKSALASIDSAFPSE